MMKLMLVLVVTGVSTAAMAQPGHGIDLDSPLHYLSGAHLMYLLVGTVIALGAMFFLRKRNGKLNYPILPRL